MVSKCSVPHPPPTVPFLPRCCRQMGERAVPWEPCLPRVRYRLGGLALTELGLAQLAFPTDPRLKVLRNPCQYLARTNAQLGSRGNDGMAGFSRQGTGRAPAPGLVDEPEAMQAWPLTILLILIHMTAPKYHCVQECRVRYFFVYACR